MTETAKEPPFSLENAMIKLAEMLKIVSEDSKAYYLKSLEKVDEKVLKDVDLSFASLSNLFQEFADQWFGSKSKGADAIQPSENLKDRIDIKLFESGKLDFEQMKKIMTRLNRIDDALMGLSRIEFYLKQYEDCCQDKKLDKPAGHARMFRISSIEIAKETLTTEGKRLGNQIERCNLYYQPAIKTRTLRVATISLAISSLSFFLAILVTLGII